MKSCALHHGHGSAVEYSVERAQKRLVAGEELVLVVDGGVARQYQRIRHVLLAAAVDDVEEQVGARLVERAATTA